MITSCVCHMTRFEPVLFVESEVEPDAPRRVHELLAHSKVSSELLAWIRALIALEMRELIERRTIYLKDGASARLEKLVHNMTCSAR